MKLLAMILLFLMGVLIWRLTEKGDRKPRKPSCNNCRFKEDGCLEYERSDWEVCPEWEGR